MPAFTQNRPNNSTSSGTVPKRWFLFLPVCQPFFLPFGGAQVETEGSHGLGTTNAKLFMLNRPSLNVPFRFVQSGAGALRSREKVPMYWSVFWLKSRAVRILSNSCRVIGD